MRTRLVGWVLCGVLPVVLGFFGWCWWSDVFAATPSWTVTWTAPTTNTDGTAITSPLTYQLYVGATGAEVKNGNPVSAPPYVLSPAPAPGVNTCVQVTAIAAGIESARSKEVCATIPLPVPGTPPTVTCTIQLNTSTTTATIACK